MTPGELPHGGMPREDEAGLPAEDRRGILAWMARNRVAANLLMLVLVVGGLFTLPSITQEVFPEFELDTVVVSVLYPGASPSEVEEGVVLAIEEAVRDVDGIKEVRATATEGAAAVSVELLLGVDQSRALADIKSAVDRITSFPEDIERPVVSLAVSRKEVLSIVVHGSTDEKSLRKLAEGVRDDLLNLPEIDVVELYAARPYEISVEVPREELRRYDLTLGQVAARVRASSVEMPGGGVKTAGGEVLVRTATRKDFGSEFEDVAVLSRPDGSQVRLGDIARIDDGFQDTDQEAYFNGQPAIMVKVFRVGDQTPIGISEVAKSYIAEKSPKLPPGIELSVWSDQSEIYADRIDLLRRNAQMGLILVMLVLGLFLEVGLAFWVTMGIPISFIGSLLLMPAFDASINMISLFAFIVTLGMVVDDAIVVGEAVYARRVLGVPPLQAAIEGAREVAMPVVFAVSTSMIAFAPMLFVPGPAGKFFRLIPLVVIAVLGISLIEALLVLPSHISHTGGFLTVIRNILLAPVWIVSPKAARAIPPWLHEKQQIFSRGVEVFIEKRYAPVLRAAVRNRYLTLATCVAIFLLTIGFVAGGRVKFTFMPKVDGDVVVADLRMPFGTAPAETRRILTRLVQTGQETLEELGGEARYSRGLFSQLGATGILMGGGPSGARGLGGGHVAEAAIFLVPTDQRPFDSRKLSEIWRRKVGDIPGAESLKFTFSMGPSAGSPIDVELEHKDLEVLEQAASELAVELGKYPGVFAIDSGFSGGKEQLDVSLKPEARALGLSELDLARQLRDSFYGAEAVRQQRGRDELRVFVRLPREERQSEYDYESLMLRTGNGGEIPLAEAVEFERGRSYTQIKRRESRRIVNVTADVDGTTANANEIVAALEKEVLPRISEKYHGLGYTYGGEQREQGRSMESLKSGFGFSAMAIFALLAVAFRSYLQPLIIMSVIPFGLVGAVIGHVALGYDLSLMSMMGVVALSGVVVNDSLIMVVAVNEFQASGMTRMEALLAGGQRRFRPIILTSLTTFFGLSPMILETSVQARFLIPMAISLGFGVLVATFITLLLVPAVYAVSEDFRAGAGWLMRLGRGEDASRAADAPGPARLG